MNTSLFQLLANLLLITANSISGAAPVSQTANYVPTIETTRPSHIQAAETRQRARIARISLADPYYSFSRAKRSHKD